jgi:hypothetical protein
MLARRAVAQLPRWPAPRAGRGVASAAAPRTAYADAPPVPAELAALSYRYAGGERARNMAPK